MEKEPKAHIEVVEGNAAVTELARNATTHVYRIASTDEKVRIKENTLYFPGWRIFVDGKESSVEFQDPAHRGLMTFFVEKGTHDVEVKFGETKLRVMSNIISVVSLVSLVLYGYYRSVKSSK